MFESGRTQSQPKNCLFVIEENRLYVSPQTFAEIGSIIRNRSILLEDCSEYQRPMLEDDTTITILTYIDVPHDKIKELIAAYGYVVCGTGVQVIVDYQMMP